MQLIIIKFCRSHKLLSGQNGYSLVELMVSGVIFGLVVLAVTSMYRSQAKMDDETNLRRQALEMMSQLTHHSVYYPKDSALAYAPLPNSSIFDTLKTQSGLAVPCTLTATVTPLNATIQSYPIEYKRIDIQLVWGIDRLYDTIYAVPHVFNTGDSI